MPGLNFLITADNADFKRKLAETRRSVTALGAAAENEASRMEKMFRSLAASAGAIFTAQQASQIISQIVRVRGEFQQLEVAFTTMLGSPAKAQKLMSEAVEFAARTPFDLKGVSDGIKQFLAYGSAAEEVIGEVEMLGNVAAGLSVPLNDMIYLFGTLRSQGTAYTIDLRQFAGRGVPIYRELSKVLGVSVSQVNQLASEGKVGFAEVEQAFRNMTSAGGQFNNLMREQSKTISGQISNLRDSIDSMFNSIGKDSEGFISSAISGVSYLVEHYREIGKAVSDIVVSYGSYKAALAIVNVALKANSMILRQAVVEKRLAAAAGITLSNAEAAAAAKTKLLSAAQAGLMKSLRSVKAALAANPYALLAVAIAAAGVGIYKLVTYQSEAEKSQKRLNSAFSEFGKSVSGDLAVLDLMFQRLRQATEGTEEYFNAKKDIVDSYGQYLDGMSDEIRSLQDTAAAYNALSEAIEGAARARAQEDYIRGEAETMAGRQNKALDKLLTKFRKQMGDEQGEYLFGRVRDILQNTDVSDGTVGEYNRVFRLVKESGADWSQSVMNSVNDYLEAARIYGQAIKDAGLKFGSGNSGGDEMLGPFLPVTAKSLREQTEEVAKEMEEARRRLSDLRKGILPENAEPDFDFASAISAQIEAIDSLKKKYDTLTGYDPKAYMEAEKASEEVSKTLKEANERIAKEEYDLQVLSTDDKIRLIEMERDAVLDSLAAELEAQKAVFAALGKPADELEKAYSKLADLTNRKYTVKVNKELDSQSEESAEELAGLLGKYQDYTAERKAIENAFNDDIEKLRKKRTDANSKEVDAAIEEARRQMSEALFELDSSNSDVFKKIFGDAAKMTKAQIREAVVLARRELAKLDQSSNPEAFQSLVEAITRLEDAEVNFDFKGWESGWDSVLKKIVEVRTRSSQLTRAAESGNETDISNATNALAVSKKELAMSLVGTGVEAFASGLASAAENMKRIAELSGDVRLGEMAGQMGAFAQNLGAAAQGASQGGWIGAIVGGVTDMLSQTVDAFVGAEAETIEMEKNMKDFAQEYAKVMRSLRDEDYESAFGTDTLRKAQDAWKKSKDVIQEYNDTVHKEMEKPVAGKDDWELNSLGMGIFLPGIASGFSFGKSLTNEIKSRMEAYKKGYTELQAMAVKTKDYSGWANFWGKKDEYTSLKDLYPELWGDDGELDIDAAKALLETNTQLTDEQRRQIQNVIDLREEYDELNEVVDNALKDILGDISTELTDAIVDSVLNGADAWDQFEDSAMAVIDRLGKQMVQEFIVQEYLKQFEDRMKEALGSGDYGTFADIMTELYKGLGGVLDAGTEAYASWIEMMRQEGYDISKLTGEREGSSKGIAQASQDSVDELNGRTTTIMGHTYAISQDIKSLGATSVRILGYASQIEFNTRNIPEMFRAVAGTSQDVRSLLRKADEMMNVGIKVR